jgi:two-component system sensor kinase FixL
VELGEQKAVLQSVLDAGPNAMLMIDQAGMITSFSAAAERLFGWRAEEMVGRNVSVLMPKPFQGDHDRHLKRYIETGARRILGKSREVKGLRRDGTHFPMMLHVEEVKLGEETQFTGFVHDLTSLRAAQDRTHELRTQLTHIWSMNSLGEMAAILAHELNQPLASITNYVRAARTLAARHEPADDDLLMAVGRAGDQSIRAGEIIRRMRDLIARKDTEHQPVSLAALISEIDFMIDLVARDRNVMVRYALADGPDEVLADRIQIQQVISNLVRNAVEAMKDSPTRVLEIQSVREPTGWVVTVGDSGPGVPPTMVEEIFEPLKSSKKQGMGLGLSISRAIIENHKGALWVKQSRLGGAAFCFMLPLDDATEDRGDRIETPGWHTQSS